MALESPPPSRLSFLETVRGRPGIFIGDTLAYWLHPGLRETVARQLAPSLEQALRAHLAVTRLIAFPRTRLGTVPGGP